jgi:hypothetical protein
MIDGRGKRQGVLESHELRYDQRLEQEYMFVLGEQ